jgi:hypothetical protein
MFVYEIGRSSHVHDSLPGVVNVTETLLAGLKIGMNTHP